MMKIAGEDIGKKYGRNWIFRKLSLEIESGSKVAIVGKNGAGKSTLLQLLAGYLTPSEGQILHNDQKIEIEKLDGVLLGPYTEIIEEMTLKEFLQFHSVFKQAKISHQEMAARASLPLDKVIMDFSTGMKQRVKLITAFYFESSVIFMDEPTANLDQEGTDWWAQELKVVKQTVIVASNDSYEIENCESTIVL